MRATLLRLAPDRHIALLTIHHASSDGWSMAVVVREAAALYRSLREGGTSSLPPLPIQYGDFAVWQRERLGEEWMAAELAYWRQVLAEIPPRVALPTDRPHPARRTFAGSHHTVSLGRESTLALQRFAEHEGVSISMIMLAALSVMLYRYTDQDDLVIGAAVTGRNRTETEQLIGCFPNVLPLRMTLRRTQTLHDVLRQARHVASAAFDHQDIPFDRLIEELAPKETSQTPLIQVMINVLTAPGAILRMPDQTVEVPGLRITPQPMDPGHIPIDLSLNVEPRPDKVHLQWHYSTELFDRGTIARLADQLIHVLDQLVDKAQTRVADVDLLDTVRSTVAARTPAPAAGIVELFQRQVGRAPDAAAAVCDGVVTTFGDLNRDANRLAHHLRALGVGAETPVGLLLEGSPRLAVAVLGILKAGGAYVPLDPAYPADRIGYLLADARVPVVVTTEALAPLAAGARPRHTVLLDNPLPNVADGDFTSVPEPTAAAYVVYTSGSTGEPKGTVIEHRSLATFAREVAERLQLGAGDRFLQFASPSFDVLAEELFPIWLAGGAVVFPAPQAGLAGPGLRGSQAHSSPPAGPATNLVQLIERERLTVMELPAAYWHEWVRELDRAGRPLPESLRLVIVGAERVLPERLAMWQKLGVPLLHVYGITETTVSSTFFRLAPNAPPGDLQHLPIGTALPSADLRILDRDLRAIPNGGVGELYIGGVSLARGYLRRPAMTAERFVADPDPAHPGERMYRTGDLVRLRADGNLEFLSRVDTQIKIRGFRVEPAEIESAMCRHPQVAQAVVAVREAAPGDRRLVAYLVPQARTRPSITDLRRFLAREIPPFAVPSTFVQLDVLPLTSNGKIDRDRLPDPGDERPELDEELVLPQSPLERHLAAIVASVLGVTVVGANDNFFELGGDSILAIQVVARAQEEGVRLSPLDLFEYPTVASLALAAAEKARADDATPAPDEPVADAGPAAAEPSGTAAPVPTAAEFPLARIDQAQLDTLLGRIADGNNA
jgi:amino acid adenylation domain-containing protein